MKKSIDYLTLIIGYFAYIYGVIVFLISAIGLIGYGIFVEKNLIKILLSQDVIQNITFSIITFTCGNYLIKKAKKEDSK